MLKQQFEKYKNRTIILQYKKVLSSYFQPVVYLNLSNLYL